MKSDIELFMEYDREVAGTYNKAYFTLDLLKSAVQNEIVDMLDISVCQKSIEEIMHFLFLKRRYLVLKNEAKEKLTASKDGFKLYGKTFSTLDEVEKAFEMKAFL